MKNEQLLQKLGLSDEESRIYLSLLDLGSANISEIAKGSGLYRPVIYKYLPGLIAKGLVSQSKMGKRAVYSAESPRSLEKQIDNMREEFDQALPSLLSSYKTRCKKPIIRFFRGKKGIAFIYEDMVNTCEKGDVIYRYESPKDYKKNKKYYPALYFAKAGCKHSEIEKFVITNEKTQEIRSQQLERYSKPIPASYDPFDYNITQLVYGNKVAFIDYDNETASIIEGASFAQFQIKLFKLLFNKL